MCLRVCVCERERMLECAMCHLGSDTAISIDDVVACRDG